MGEDKSQWDVITLEGLKQAAKEWMMVMQGQNCESMIALFMNMKISPKDVLNK
jgi:predicted Holliday junction resolvase-like endonuclease